MGDSNADKSLLRLFLEVTIAVAAGRHADVGAQFFVLDSKHCYSLNGVPNRPIGLCSLVLSSERRNGPQDSAKHSTTTTTILNERTQH